MDSGEPSRIAASPDTLLALAAQIGRPVRREGVHVWVMSAVERVHLDGGATVILKSAVQPFDREDRVLRHAAAHGVPVASVLTSTHRDGWMAMLLEDLGATPPRREPLSEGARAAVVVHACPALDALETLDAAALAALPTRALASLDALQARGRWTDADEVRSALERLSAVAVRRAQGTELAPFGMCHSEFHPTSLVEGRILDWARAFTGPGLLDLSSWEDTIEPLDTRRIADMIDAYIDAGGAASAASERAGLPAAVWAGGWHRVWISEWFLQQSVRWIDDPRDDQPTEEIVRRHLREALDCLA